VAGVGGVVGGVVVGVMVIVHQAKIVVKVEADHLISAVLRKFLSLNHGGKNDILTVFKRFGQISRMKLCKPLFSRHLMF
jgi:hypothetical protein